MKVLVLGANGQLGSDVIRVLKERHIPSFAASRKEVDIRLPKEIKQLCETQKPDAIVNCAAFHDVVKCEDDPALAMEINAKAVGSIAKICEKRGIKFLTISSDYVFDGKKVKGYTEHDLPNPLMSYGQSKLAGENIAFEYCSNAFVVRVQSLYGEANASGKGLNFVDLMMKLSSEKDELKVDQCKMAPTWTYPLAQNLITLLDSNHFGLYHMSAMGMTTWFEFAQEIIRIAKRNVTVTAVDNDFYPRNFIRPENTYLMNDNLTKIDCNLMPSWQTCLEGYLSIKYGLQTQKSDEIR